jgi:hypothetical protein
VKPLYILAALLLSSVAQAQTAWDTNTIAWDAPTTCTSGQPIANCPVTSYRVERSATATGTFATLGTSATTTYTHLSAAAGQNCYRVIAIAATGESVPSNVACKTNTQPAGPPNPPTNVTIAATTVYEVRPNLQRFTFERGNILRGVSAKIGNGCAESRCVDGGYCVISSRRSITPRPAEGTVLLARCG